MQKILIKVTKDSLAFSIYTKETSETNINNTNIIDTKNIIFTDNYIIENLELVSAFLNVLILKNDINTIKVKHLSIIRLVLNLTNYLPNLTALYILENASIDNMLAQTILESKYITYFNCFNMSNLMFDKLNQKMTVEVRSEIFSISTFMKNNNLLTYSDVYYKKTVIIDCELDKIDLNDFENFLQNNKKLKTIDIKKYSNENINQIIETLIKNDKKNIKINIFEENENIISEINYLKKLQNIVKKNKVDLKIIYSDEYKQKNFLKQINLNILMAAIIIVIIFVIGIFVIYKFFDFKQENEIKDIQNKVEEIKEEETTLPAAKVKEENDYTKEYSKVLTELKKINNETVGWLKVNNTNVDYPVVKHSDNNYYLNHSFSQKVNQNGWLFADYRNKINPIDMNTIIYGHNDGNIMFGSLRKVLDKSWYSNQSNQIITFDTGNGSSKWKIFSIYTEEVSNDYLVVNFETTDGYSSFLNKLTKKSIYNFNNPVSPNDKILTLSTCYNNSDYRLVIHAKRIA